MTLTSRVLCRGLGHLYLKNHLAMPMAISMAIPMEWSSASKFPAIPMAIPMGWSSASKLPVMPLAIPMAVPAAIPMGWSPASKFPANPC